MTTGPRTWSAAATLGAFVTQLDVGTGPPRPANVAQAEALRLQAFDLASQIARGNAASIQERTVFDVQRRPMARGTARCARHRCKRLNERLDPQR